MKQYDFFSDVRFPFGAGEFVVTVDELSDDFKSVVAQLQVCETDLLKVLPQRKNEIENFVVALITDLFLVSRYQSNKYK